MDVGFRNRHTAEGKRAEFIPGEGLRATLGSRGRLGQEVEVVVPPRAVTFVESECGILQWSSAGIRNPQTVQVRGHLATAADRVIAECQTLPGVDAWLGRCSCHWLTVWKRAQRRCGLRSVQGRATGQERGLIGLPLPRGLAHLRRA